jgi:D-alanyl-D-alanine carboxypeptidase
MHPGIAVRTSPWAGAACFCIAACLCVVDCATPFALDAPTIETGLETRVDAVVGEWLASTDAPSVSIAVVRSGKLVYAKAYGQARLRPSVAATPGTRYAIDSLTKEFTAAAILLLAEQGKLALDDRLNKWLPNLGEAAQVTLRQILTHTSGIRDYWPEDFVTPEMTVPASPAGIIQEWVKRPLDFEPGTEWQYSNTGYVVAADVVERVSGARFFDFLQHNLFTPLGMARVTDYTLPAAPPDAVGYTRHALGFVGPAPKESAGWLFGAANLAMRPSDLALWDISLMERSLLHAKSYDTEFTPVVLKDGTTVPYGLGLDIEHVRGRLRIGHSGSGSGFLADNRLWPDERTAIVVLTNNDWASPEVLSNRIGFLVLKPSPAEARARAVFTEFQQGSIDRMRFTATGNFYLTGAVLADLRTSLSKLGPARDIELEQESKRGGMITRHWKILCRNARLEVIERGYADGKLDEFLVTKRED